MNTTGETNEERIHRLDQDMANCLETLRTLIPASTMSGNVNMVVAAQFVMDALVQHHQAKMAILYSSGASELTNLYQYHTPETPEDIRRRFSRDNAHIVTREYLDTDDEEEGDSGPLQLSDLMDVEGEGHEEDDDTGTPVRDERYNAYMDPNEEEWPTIEQDWTEDEAEEALPVNVTIRARRDNQRRVRLFASCNRKNVCLSEDAQHKMDEMCNVCFDTPMMVDACVTDCGHHFCKGCFSEWENRARVSDEGTTMHVTCPVCRAVRPEVTEYTVV